MNTPDDPVEDPLKWLDEGLPDLSGYNHTEFDLVLRLISNATLTFWLTVYLTPGKYQTVEERQHRCLTNCGKYPCCKLALIRNGESGPPATAGKFAQRSRSAGYSTQH